MSAGVAQYVQLASVLRHQIAHGTLAPGQQLPTVAELATREGVARITVRQAYGLLGQEGLVTSTRGRGTFVVGQPPALDARLRHAINDPQAGDFRMDILERRSGEAMPADLRGDTSVYPAYSFIRKVHRHDDEPFCRVDIHVAAELEALFPKDGPAHHKIAWLLERHAAGRMASVQQTLTVAPADGVLAHQLACAFATPIVQMTRRVLDTDGRLALAGRFWYRGDRFVMDMAIPFSVWANYPGVVMPDSRARAPENPEPTRPGDTAP